MSETLPAHHQTAAMTDAASPLDEEATGPVWPETNAMADTRWRVRSALEEREDAQSCLNRAAPLEPVFVLRGEDQTAARTVGFYRLLLELENATRGEEAPPKHRAVSAIMRAMTSWPNRKVPGLGSPANAIVPRVRTASQELQDADSVVNRCDPAEPVFVLRAGDGLAAPTIQNYIFNGINAGIPAARLDAAVNAYHVFAAWISAQRINTMRPFEPVADLAVQESPGKMATNLADASKQQEVASNIFVSKSRHIGAGNYVCREIANPRMEVVIVPQVNQGDRREREIRTFTGDQAWLNNLSIKPGSVIRYDDKGITAVLNDGVETWRRPQLPTAGTEAAHQG